MAYDLGTAHGRITMDYDGDRAVDRAEHDVDRLRRAAVGGERDFGRLGQALGALGRGVRLGGIATAIGAAAIQAASLGVQLLGIVPALASILSLSSALPGIFVGMIAAVGVLKAAFSGVGDTLKAAFDPKGAAKFAEGLKQLAPAAQDFAKAVKANAGPLKQFQQSLQQSFFEAAHLAGQVPRMVKALALLKPQLGGLAADFGELTRRMANFALSGDSLGFASDAVTAFDAALMSAGRAILPVLAGLRDVGGNGLPLLLRLGDAVGDLGVKFGAWLTAISNDGRLNAWIDLAISTLKTLGTILSNVASIFGAVFSAAAASGGGLLNTLALITGEISKFLSSAEGTAALTGIFSAIIAVAKPLVPVITTLVGALAKALAPAIQQIATVLGPVLLQMVTALAPAFGPLATAIAELVTAIAPLLPPIAVLATLLAQVLSTAVGAIVRELGPLVAVIGGALLQAFEAFQPVIGEMAKGLPLAASAGVQLAAAFAPLVPVIVELAQAIAGSLVEAMPQLIQAAEDLLPTIIDLAEQLSGSLGQALEDLIPLIPPLISAFITLAPIILQLATMGPRLVGWILGLREAIRGVVDGIPAFTSGLISGIGGALTSAYNAVLTAGQAIIDWFVALPGRIVSAISTIGSFIATTFVDAIKGAATALGFGLGLLVGIALTFPMKIWNAMAALPGLIRDLFVSMWNQAKNATLAAIGVIVGVAKTLPGKATNAIRSLGGLIAGVAKSAWNSLKSIFTGGVNNATSTAKGLPGRIKSALSALPSLLINSGKQLINGLINGIQSGIGRVLGMVSGLADRVKGAFNKALSIFSPSKDFMESGVNIVEGLVVGIFKKINDAKSAAVALANTIIAPTLALPRTAQAAINSMPAVKNSTTAASHDAREFGPYSLEIDGKVITSFAVDAITGNPRVVAAASAEGSRRISWTGSGRMANASL